MPSMKNETQSLKSSPSALRSYFLASRPKTWIASISPVLIGTLMADTIYWNVLALTLLFALLIQIGTNYANDYFDFVQGADTHLRNGPKRATLEGWISPKGMQMAFLLTFLLAFCIAIPLMQQVGLWSVFLAISCIFFGIFYTAGPKPLGYLGLGELLVFIYFGPVAVLGSYLLQTKTLSLAVLTASFVPALLSCAILVANNLRDEKSDRLAGKKTLIVRFGKVFGAFEYTLCLVLSFLVPLFLVCFFSQSKLLLLSMISFFPAIFLIKKVFSFKDPLELIFVLEKTAMMLILYTVLFCLCV